MAYCNWGAFVFCNGIRCEDKEDCVLFGEALHSQSFADYYHGVMGDGNIRVGCYKCCVPKIFEQTDDGAIRQIKYTDSLKFDIQFEYRKYQFHFKSGDPCVAKWLNPTVLNGSVPMGMNMERVGSDYKILGENRITPIYSIAADIF